MASLSNQALTEGLADMANGHSRTFYPEKACSGCVQTVTDAHMSQGTMLGSDNTEADLRVAMRSAVNKGAQTGFVCYQ